METTIKINTDSLSTDFIEGIKKLFPHQVVEINIQPADTTEYILSNPKFKKELQERIETYKKAEKKKKKKSEKNLQIPGDPLSDEDLIKAVKEAEKGPFISIEEHNKRMDEWIQENFR